jgi:signal transduction histidine kinase
MLVTNQLNSFRRQLEEQLNYPFYFTQGMTTLFRADQKADGFEFEEYSDKFLAWAVDAEKNLPYIRNIALSDGYVIRLVYPEEGNSVTIGRDYRNLPGQWELVEQAVESGQPVVAGPLNLIQGGVGVINRTPLYNNDAEKSLLGIVSMVIDFPQLLDKSGISDAEKELKILIGSIDEQGFRSEPFYGESITFDEQPVTQPVLFVGGSWYISAQPKFGWSLKSPYSNAFTMLGAIVSVAIFLLSYLAIQGHRQQLSKARSFSQQLENQVIQRTEELQQARDSAVQASKAKSDFLAVMTHELRTPLNSIIGLSQLVEEMELGNVQRDYIEKVQVSAQMLLSLINNILSYSKIESGNAALSESIFKPQELVDAMSSVFAVGVANDNVKFIVNVAPNVPAAVRADKEKIIQVLTNLCGNASKFTRQGSVTLSLSASYKNTSPSFGAILKFEVADTGIGIDLEQQSYLFKPFTQVDSSLARQFNGTGLGLSICKRLVGIMHGEIGVDSVPSEGSMFWFTIPVTLAANTELAEEVGGNISDLITRIKPKLSGKTVILAEDNVFNQTLAKALLAKVDVKVLIANNGLEVLDLLQHHHDVVGILMDLQMPKLDGLAATKKIKEIPEYKNLPIIAMTANAMTEDRQKTLAAGMNGFISKPINTHTLFTTMARWF